MFTFGLEKTSKNLHFQKITIQYSIGTSMILNDTEPKLDAHGQTSGTEVSSVLLPSDQSGHSVAAAFMSQPQQLGGSNWHNIDHVWYVNSCVFSLISQFLMTCTDLLSLRLSSLLRFAHWMGVVKPNSWYCFRHYVSQSLVVVPYAAFHHVYFLGVGGTAHSSSWVWLD